MIYKGGFTLIELLIVCCIIGFLLLFSVPSEYVLYEKNQIKIISDKIKAIIQYGRNMAIAQGTTLALTPLNNQDWTQGLVLFIDNKKHMPTKESIIHSWQWPTNTVKISWKGFQSSDYLLFSPSLKIATCNGHFLLTPQHARPKKLMVNRFCYVHIK